jgi:hypothetical protein
MARAVPRRRAPRLLARRQRLVRVLGPALVRELELVHRLLVEARRLPGMGISSRVQGTATTVADTTSMAAHRTMVSRNSNSRSRTISKCCGIITRSDRGRVLADRDRGDIAAA